MKTLKTITFTLVALTLSFVVAGLSACSDDDGGGGQAETAQLRVIHLSPDAPAVDVFANGGEPAAVSNLAFSESTQYLTLDTGTYDFNVSATGTSPSESVLDIEGVALMAHGSYTAVAFGELSSIQSLTLEEDRSELESGEIRVRAIHTAAGVGQVDIWNLPDEGAPSALYENVDFGIAGDYIDLPSGAYTLGFDVDDDASPDLIFELPNLPEGTIANVFAVAEGGDVYLLTQLQDGSVSRIDATEMSEPAQLRVLHLSPDAPNVDVFVGGTEPAAVSDLAFESGTGYLELEAGTYTFNVSAAGTGPSSSVLDIEDLELVEGGHYTAVAFDEIASIQALPLADDMSTPSTGNIRVRAIHTATGIGEVDIWNLPATGDPSILYENVGFGVAGDAVELPADAYTLGIDVDDDMMPDLVFELPDLSEGTIANIFAVADGSDVFLLAQFEDGSTARIDPTPQPAMLRVIHLSHDAPGVDVFVDGAEPAAVTNLEFESSTSYLELAAGTYSFNVSATGTGPNASVLDINDLELMAGRHYTAVAFDELSSIQALPLTDDLSGLDTGNIRVRAIHAAFDVGQVDIWNIPDQGAPSLLYEDVDFGVVGDYVDLPAGAYTLGFDVDNDENPDLVFELPDLPAGTVANVFAVSDSSSVYLVAQLGGSTTAVIDATP